MAVFNIADPNCPIPEYLIFDASILLELGPVGRSENVQLQQAVSLYMRRIGIQALSGKVLCLAPVLTLEECYFRIIQIHYHQELPNHKQRLQSQLGRGNIKWHDLYKDNPTLIQQWMPDLYQFRTVIQSIPIQILEPEDLGDPPPSLEPKMVYHIANMPILPKDAYLLAVVERLNVLHLVTLDKDFSSASSWLNIYTYS